MLQAVAYGPETGKHFSQNREARVAADRRPRSEWQLWVIHDRVEPGPAMSAFPRLRPMFCGVAKFRDVPLPNLVELQGDMLTCCYAL